VSHLRVVARRLLDMLNSHRAVPRRFYCCLSLQKRLQALLRLVTS
jgi:hypothetical protein